MGTVIWIIIGAAVLGALFGGKGSRPSGKPVRIDHPHLIDPDEYECGVCGRRFGKERMSCPYCGARFSGTVTDEEEYDEEEDEMEAWDEEDGL